MSEHNPQPERPEMTHFYILTLDVPGRESSSVRGELAIPPGTPRLEVFNFLRDQIVETNPAMSKAVPICFTLDPVTA